MILLAPWQCRESDLSTSGPSKLRSDFGKLICAELGREIEDLPDVESNEVDDDLENSHSLRGQSYEPLGNKMCRVKREMVAIERGDVREDLIPEIEEYFDETMEDEIYEGIDLDDFETHTSGFDGDDDTSEEEDSDSEETHTTGGTRSTSPHQPCAPDHSTSAAMHLSEVASQKRRHDCDSVNYEVHVSSPSKKAKTSITAFHPDTIDNELTSSHTVKRYRRPPTPFTPAVEDEEPINSDAGDRDPGSPLSDLSDVSAPRSSPEPELLEQSGQSSAPGDTRTSDSERDAQPSVKVSKQSVILDPTATTPCFAIPAPTRPINSGRAQEAGKGAIAANVLSAPVADTSTKTVSLPTVNDTLTVESPAKLPHARNDTRAREELASSEEELQRCLRLILDSANKSEALHILKRFCFANCVVAWEKGVVAGMEGRLRKLEAQESGTRPSLPS